MAKLVIISRGMEAAAFELAPGLSSLGRADTNSLHIADPSVSGRHCELTVNGNGILVRDLASTNGTFINEIRVEEGVLAPNQILKVGSVELRYEPELAPAAVRIIVPARTPPVLPPAAKLPPPRAKKPTRTFFQELPRAFLYPLRKDGFSLMIGGMILIAIIRGLQGVFLIGLLISVLAGGYLFAYLQSIVSTSAQGEEEMPKWPDFSDWLSDIIEPYFQTMVTIFVCFLPAIFFGWAFGPNPLLLWVGILAGALYFPMALMGVSIAQSLSGLNPALVIPSILRVPLQYTVACFILLVVFAIYVLTDYFIPKVIGSIPVITNCVGGFLWLYVLTVEMRILGLLYFTNRERLKWF